MSVLPMNTKNMTIPTCDNEKGTFMTSINQYLKSSATKLHNLCSTTISKDKLSRFYFLEKRDLGWCRTLVPFPAGLFEFCKYSTVILHKLSLVFYPILW
jgi:hypothetical protein